MEDIKPVSKELDDFLKNYTNDIFSLRVFLFFTDHPYAQFSEMVVMSAAGQCAEKRYIQKALKDFVEKGIIQKNTSFNVNYYSLPESIQKIALEMQKLEQKQRYSLMGDSGNCVSTWRNGVLRMPLPLAGY